VSWSRGGHTVGGLLVPHLHQELYKPGFDWVLCRRIKIFGVQQKRLRHTNRNGPLCKLRQVLRGLTREEIGVQTCGQTPLTILFVTVVKTEISRSEQGAAPPMRRSPGAAIFAFENSITAWGGESGK
jgi:hypothetical protein